MKVVDPDAMQTASRYREDANIPSLIQAKEVVECIRVLLIGISHRLEPVCRLKGIRTREISTRCLDIEEKHQLRRPSYNQGQQQCWEDILVRKNILITSRKKTKSLGQLPRAVDSRPTNTTDYGEYFFKKWKISMQFPEAKSADGQYV
jgi:hypothetical protein